MARNVKDKYKGMSPYRYEQNPLEKALALAWQDHNDDGGRTTLDYIMDESGRGEPKPHISERDMLVANTVVQWLGSPVGQGFLAEVLSTSHGKYFRERLELELEQRKRK